ncbi:tripartite tricarboxylate transporter substrate binding protein [Curvibacter sp. HBC28]|uniref:Tripartite tricarboxylate transporter substrate binding protein n=1 Tax=Curvibacter microcysteis TaxID=3026419 RepID=A0ABT5MJ07_9BURK|nr:tripartite tricarboxylate transporter substrate binding protein [Curvibacter sp. HBC28]MDD0816523.1 tripartite tricarboxylate transporter substrate binding protein [Curvibacter sp. HBC28]
MHPPSLPTSVLLNRRQLGTLALLAPWGAQAQAQAPAYPARPVKLINAFPPGGPSDILARSVGEVLQGVFKQPFVVDNRPGAGGNLGTDQVAKSPADGHTVLIGIDSTFTVNPHIYKNLPFKLSDFKPVMVMASSGLMAGASPGTGLRSMAQLVQKAKQQTLNFSSGGSGSPGHLAVEVLSEATGAHIQHIPYKGNTPAVAAVLAGEVDAGVLATPGMLPHVKAGKITPLAVTSRQRSRLAPEVPTVAELGFKELEQEVLYIALVPAATPDNVVQTLQRAFAEAMARPEIQTRLQALDLQAEKDSGEAMVQRLNQASERYRRVIQATGMKVE